MGWRRRLAVAPHPPCLSLPDFRLTELNSDKVCIPTIPDISIAESDFFAIHCCNNRNTSAQ